VHDDLLGERLLALFLAPISSLLQLLGPLPHLKELLLQDVHVEDGDVLLLRRYILGGLQRLVIGTTVSLDRGDSEEYMCEGKSDGLSWIGLGELAEGKREQQQLSLKLREERQQGEQEVCRGVLTMDLEGEQQQLQDGELGVLSEQHRKAEGELGCEARVQSQLELPGENPQQQQQRVVEQQPGKQEQEGLVLLPQDEQQQQQRVVEQQPGKQEHRLSLRSLTVRGDPADLLVYSFDHVLPLIQRYGQQLTSLTVQAAPIPAKVHPRQRFGATAAGAANIGSDYSMAGSSSGVSSSRREGSYVQPRPLWRVPSWECDLVEQAVRELMPNIRKLELVYPEAV
jgi:hypothetical protein